MSPNHHKRDDDTTEASTSQTTHAQDKKALAVTSSESHVTHERRGDTPDAWFTLCVVFLVNVLLGLNWIAFSVFYIHFTDNFDTEKSVTGWIGSIQSGLKVFGRTTFMHVLIKIRINDAAFLTCKFTKGLELALQFTCDDDVICGRYLYQPDGDAVRLSRDVICRKFYRRLRFPAQFCSCRGVAPVPDVRSTGRYLPCTVHC